MNEALITIGLPTYRNADIIWLQLESLSRQKDAPKWELIIVEEPSENYFSVDEIEKWWPKLKKANCVNIEYVSKLTWIPLSEKWLEITKRMATTSIGMLLCASDNYSPSDRIKKTYDKLLDGFDWVQTESGYFYDIVNHKAAIYKTTKPEMTGLFMAVSKTAIDRADVTGHCNKSVDSWLMKITNSKKIFNFGREENGLHTDGFNTISIYRKQLYANNITPLFTETNPDEVIKILPKQIFTKLKAMAQRKKATGTKQPEPRKIEYNLDPKVEHVVIGTGKNKEIPKGKEYIESASSAAILLQKGLVTLKPKSE